jgi:hypothetical protein
MTGTTRVPTEQTEIKITSARTRWARPSRPWGCGRTFEALIRGRGVVPAAVTETKTRQVLEYLSSEAARGSR